MTGYELRIVGHLDSEVALAIGPFRDVVARGGVTVLRGEVASQEELHAALDTARSFGLELIEIRQTDDRRATEPDRPDRHPTVPDAPYMPR